MPTFLIEREIPGASTLTHDELAYITAKSKDVVAPQRALPLGHQLRRRRQGLLLHETEKVETNVEHAQRGGFPPD